MFTTIIIFFSKSKLNYNCILASKVPLHQIVNTFLFKFISKAPQIDQNDAWLRKSYGSFFLNGVNEEETTFKRSDPLENLKVYFL